MEEETRLCSLKTKLTRRKRLHWKRSFVQGQAAKDVQLKILMEELNQLLNRSYAFKIDCVMSCAERIIEHHLEHDSRAIIAIAEKVLKNVAEHIDVELATHPLDAAILASSLHEIPLANASRRTVVVTADDALRRGSLVVKANKSIIDAHLTTQLGRARAILLT